MITYGKRRCLTCGGWYRPTKKWRQKYCSVKCYQTHIKEIRKAQKNLDKLSCPDFKCPRCKKVTTLTFNPILDIKSWVKFQCECGYRRSGDNTID